MSTNGSATPPPPGDGDTGDANEDFSCFFCDGVVGTDNVRRHVDGCEQAKIDAERKRLAGERLRQQYQGKGKEPPRLGPAGGAKNTPAGPGPLPPDSAKTYEQIEREYRERKARGEFDAPFTPNGQPGGVPFPRPEQGTGGMSQEEIEARLTPEQREALRNLRLGKEQQAWKEAGRRPEDVDTPAWMRDMLQSQGVPPGFFQEFRGGTGLPDPERVAAPPDGDEAMMPFHPTPDPVIRNWWSALSALEAFYDGLDQGTVEGVRELRRNLGLSYVNAGAIYGPSEAGMLQWAGEVTTMQRNMAKTAEIAQRQQMRMAVNERFPRFWRGEWVVEGQDQEQQEAPALPPPDIAEQLRQMKGDRLNTGETLPPPPDKGPATGGDAPPITPKEPEQPPAPPSGEIDTSWMD